MVINKKKENIQKKPDPSKICLSRLRRGMRAVGGIPVDVERNHILQAAEAEMS